MAVERGPKSLHEHNKSLLYSNRPKFKEDIRENIYLDKIRTDGVKFLEIEEIQVRKVIAEIKSNARKELIREFKMLLASIAITLVILFYLKEYLDHVF